MSENSTAEEQIWAVPGAIDHDSDGVPRLVAGHCAHCVATYYPRPQLCPTCWSEDVRKVMLPRVGTLYSYSVVHTGRAGWQTPYLLGAVDFPEINTRVVGVLKGPPDWRPALDSSVRVGVGHICSDAKGAPVFAHQFHLET